MFNDDPYKLQRVKPQQGAVGGAPVAPVATRTPQPPPGLPPNASRTTLPPSSIVKPATRYLPAMPPAAKLSIAQPPPAFGSAVGSLARPHATLAEVAKPPATLGAVIGGALLSPTAQAAVGMTPAAPTPLPGAPATLADTPMSAGALRRGGKSPDYTSNNGIRRASPGAPLDATPAAAPAGAPQSTVIGFTGDGLSGKANAAAPGQVAVSEMRSPIQQGFTQINSGFYRTPTGATLAGQAPTSGAAVGGRPLPGAPLVGADGSVQYDQAWADKNKALLADYAQKNTMPFGVPAPGVAASMVTGGYTPSGGLTQTPRGFTREDRARQLEAMTDRGNAYRAGEAADYARTRGRMAIASGDLQRAEAIGKQAMVESGMQVAPPTASSQAMGTQRLAGQKQAVDQGNEAAKLAMDQEAQAVINEQNQAQTETQKLQLQQAQQMQALTTQLLQGTPEQKKAATASLAALQGTKPGAPIKIQREVPITDKMGGVTMQKVEGLYDPTTGTEKWFDQQSAQPAGYAIGPDGKRYQVNADGTITEAPAQ